MPETDHVSFLAYENFDLNIVKLLRQEGFFVNSIAEMAPSITDPQVLAIAVDQKAVVLTEDRDFGECLSTSTHTLWYFAHMPYENGPRREGSSYH